MKNKDIIDNGSVIAIIGAGKGGLALLKVLLRIPAVKIKYVYDIDPWAAAVLYAKNNNINCTTDFDQIIVDEEVDLIFEASGDPQVFKNISEKKSPETSLIGAKGSKIIFHFLDDYNKINRNLNEYKANLEKKIIQRTEDLEKVNFQLEKEMLEYEKISQKLKEINKEKTKYLLYATHQLKAPFGAIQSYADIILEGYTGTISLETRDIIQKVKRRCELLSRVIKEMLELEKLKSRDEIVLNIRKINISTILTNTIQQFKISAKNKKIKIDYTPLKKSYYIKGDKKQIEILFSILLENAIDYSPSESAIKIIAKKIEGPRIYIGIQDQGIGIPEKNQENIFNEFFRSNNATSFHKNGTGLGLSIAREIIKIHNASINVESALEKGSLFSVAFKLI